VIRISSLVIPRYVRPRQGYCAAAALLPLPFFGALTCGPVLAAAIVAFSRRVSRLRLRAAAFLWIVPLAATQSSRCTTLFNCSRALASSPPASAALKLLISVLIMSLRARLRDLLRKFCRMRFFAESEWATVLISSIKSADEAYRHAGWESIEMLRKK